MDEAWDSLDGVVVIPCFDCGDDIVMDAALEAETALCDMCSVNWDSLVDQQYRSTSNY